ncbi:MAG: hypothetical protein IJ894_13335 [Bacteroidales bacterium]|jgi:hypothetical protein|nr:hypothetical protein [Bacteroidales bacterium]
MKINRIQILAAALTLTAIASLLSCKGDDDSDSPAAPSFKPIDIVVPVEPVPDYNIDENARKEIVPAVEYNVALLLQEWCGINDETRPKDFMSKTFAPTIGEPTDNPTEIIHAVCNIEYADTFAIKSFANLGINADAPDGFQYQGDGISVSYTHINDGNTLAVINASVPQIPNLTKITLVKQLDEKALDNPTYYHCGDIKTYKDIDYICVSRHKFGEMSRWISFDGDFKYNNLEWLATGNDFVYKDAMASPQTIAAWLQNIFFDPDMLMDAMDANNPAVVPSEEAVELLADRLLHQQYVLDVFKAPESPLFRTLDTQDLWSKESNKDGYTILTYAPNGLLLTGKTRWTMSNDNKNHYWQPYLALVRSEDKEQFEAAVKAQPSQGDLSPKMFHWAKIADNVEGENHADGEQFTYSLYVVAMYWRHEVPEGDYRFCLLNFTKDWSKKNNTEFFDYDWTARNIRTKEIVFADFGKPYDFFED